MHENLLQFTVRYVAALEESLTRFGRERFPLHGDRIQSVWIYKACDGYVAFYLPAARGGNVRTANGCGLLDYSKYDLNSICQTLHLNQLRVGAAEIGKSVGDQLTIPVEVPRIPELGNADWFSSEIRKAAHEGRLSGNSLGMMVTPIYDVEKGVYVGVSPSRVKVWSPTVEIPGVGCVRQYEWTHADFWWTPDGLGLNEHDVGELARNDLVALGIALGASGGNAPAAAGQDTSSRAATILEHACDELLQLIANHGDDEERLHQWLNRPEHHLFIDLECVEILSKVPFGNKKSDFVVRRSNGTYVLVEIEPAASRIFQKQGQEPTSEFNHACQQVRDWQRYIRDNVQTVRTEQGLRDIDQPQGYVIIGRTEDISGKDALMRWRDMKCTNDIGVATYDDLCERVRALAKSLRQALRK